MADYQWSSSEFRRWLAEGTVEWIPDVDRNACMHCRESFGWFGRKHHCRKCGKIICGKCSVFPKELKPEHATTGCPERICIGCSQIYHNLHRRIATTP